MREIRWQLLVAMELRPVHGMHAECLECVGTRRRWLSGRQRERKPAAGVLPRRGPSAGLRMGPHLEAAQVKGTTSLEAKVGGRGSLAAGYSAHKKAQSRPGFGLLRASVLTSNREEKQLVL